MNYSNIINSILSDKILSLEEKFMLISLKILDKYGDNIVTVGYETLMEYSNTTRRAKISNILKSLKEKKYIEWKRCGRKENEYRFIKEKESKFIIKLLSFSFIILSKIVKKISKKCCI